MKTMFYIILGVLVFPVKVFSMVLSTQTHITSDAPMNMDSQTQCYPYGTDGSDIE